MPLPPRRRLFRFGLRTMFVVVTVLSVLCAIVVLLPATPDSRRRPRCKNNLKAIGLALYAYASDHGSFPPAYIADKDGKPMHSWRVLILPYMDEQELFNQYDFSQPWNSPQNAKLAGMMPEWFRCPQSKNLAPGNTNYVASVGPGAVFEGNHATQLGEITDAIPNTIAVIEVRDAGAISWLNPRDVVVSSLASNHQDGANAVFADTSVQYLESSLAPATLKALQTIAGGEDLSKLEAENSSGAAPTSK